MSAPVSLLATVAFALFSAAGQAADADAEVAAWSRAFASWVDVSHNIACPALKPRIDALTTRLGEVQDAFVARHPDYVFPPMIFAQHPFVGCDDGARLLDRAEARATTVADMLRATAPPDQSRR